jgi:hypothetical protein
MHFKGILLSAIVAACVSPAELACGSRLPICLARDGASAGEDGVVDSLRSLLLSGSYNITDSPERELVKLFVRDLSCTCYKCCFIVIMYLLNCSPFRRF